MLHFTLLHILLDNLVFDEFWYTKHCFDQPLHLLVIVLACLLHPVKQHYVPMDFYYIAFRVLGDQLGLYTSLNQLHVLDHLPRFVQKLRRHEHLLVLQEHVQEDFLGSFLGSAFFMADSGAHQGQIESDFVPEDVEDFLIAAKPPLLQSPESTNP